MQFGFGDDLKTAMKAGDKTKVATLRLLIAALKNERIQAARDLTGEEVEAAVRRAVKQRKDSIEQYQKGGRQDLVDAENAELAVLQTYLPKGLSEADLEAAVRAIVAEKGFTTAKDVGLVMKELMARHRGRVDGKRAQEMARQILP
ncbi:MAG TPA: GatB/YqeY domain-containing protein [Thermoanaerobaculia bacterium]|nr:GatB/YqeY domain-containing protein [Thermoanaerobaculia bacterium]